MLLSKVNTNGMEISNGRGTSHFFELNYCNLFEYFLPRRQRQLYKYCIVVAASYGAQDLPGH